jgi:hypothetical protein
MHPRLSGDPLDAGARLAEVTDVLPAGTASLPSSELVLLRSAERWLRYGGRGGDLVGRLGVLDASTAAANHLIERLAAVLDQVEPVCHLDRVGRTGSCAIGVRTSTIPDDDLDAGVGLQPVRQGRGRALQQQVQHLVKFQVHQDRPVAVAAPERKVVDPEDARRRATT